MNLRSRLPLVLVVLFVLFVFVGMFIVPTYAWETLSPGHSAIRESLPSEVVPPASFSGTQPFVPGRVLLKLREENVSLETVFSEAGVAAWNVEPVGYIRPLHVHVLHVPSGLEEETARRLQESPLVRYAEPDYIYHALTKRPNDPYYTQYQWQLPHIGAETAWDTTTGSSDVVIAVLDTGVDLGHPDLAAKIVSGYDFINNDNDPDDDQGHGTHVAGIAAAVTDNNIGIAGVSWGARIMPVKVLNNEGAGPNSTIAQAMVWAVDQGADVLNMSLGGETRSSTMEDAVTYAYEHGVLVVAAAGNSYEEGNATSYPAAYDHVLAVAATDDEDEHASYSNSGSYVDVAAPGGDPSGNTDTNPNHWILSTYYRSSGNSYVWMSGTSQAAPHVAGLAALLLSLNPSLSPDDLTDIIENTAVDVQDTGWDEFSGYGRIDVAAAVAAVLATPTPTSSPTATPTPVSTSTPTLVPSPTATATATETPTAVPTSPTVTVTPTPTGGASPTTTPTMTPTPTPTPTGSVSPTSTPTPTATPTPTTTWTVTVTPSPTPTPTSFPYPHQDDRVNQVTAGVQDVPAVGVGRLGRVVVAWRDIHTNPGHIVVSTRDADADQWSTGQPIGNVTDGGVVPLRPRVAVGPLGRAAVVWHNVSNNDHDIYLVTGTLASDRWDAPQEIGQDGSTPSDQILPAVAIGEDGTLYVVWEDNRNGSPDIFWSYRRPGESAWHPAAAVPGAAGPERQTQPTIALADRMLYVAWVDMGRGTVRVARYDITQHRWALLPGVGGGFPAQAHPSFPTLAVEHGRVHVLWQDSRNTRHGVDIYHSVWNHGTWSPAVRVNRDPMPAVQLLPGAAPTADGIVAVWADKRSGTFQVYMAWWQVGEGWVGERQVATSSATAPQTDPAVATDGDGNAFIVWTDGRDAASGADVYFRYVPLSERYRLHVPLVGSASDW